MPRIEQENVVILYHDEKCLIWSGRRKSCQDSNSKVAFTRFLKYNAGRRLMNLERNQMTKLVSNGLKLEILGRKIKPSVGGQEGRA